MAKLRSISTSFWSDPWIEDLSPTEKLLFIYLITNERTNMLGIYESSVKKISFETGIDKASVDKALKGFESLGKVKYSQNYVIVKNYLKHQNFNTNMMKSAIDVYNNLPNDLKIKGLEVDKSNPSESFERLSNAMGMVRKIEVEYEEEIEEENKIEEEKENKKPQLSVEDTFNLFWDHFHKITGKRKTDKDAALKKWKSIKSIDEKKKAYVNVKPWFNSIENKGENLQYVKKCRSYLDDKSYNDEFGKPSQSEKIVYKGILSNVSRN